MAAPGRRVLGDRYELQTLIATGGMGQVWRGLDTLLGRPVAVKVLRSEYTGDPTFIARFRAEAQHTAALSHPNIAAVHDYGEDPDCDGDGGTCAYLVMELVEGEPLSALLYREGPIGVEATLAVLRQTAAALAVAHSSGVVHRDVKPGNILVRPDGSVKITDFGIAWSAASVPLTQTGQVVGTAHYLSPEQAEGRHASPASDVYSLGMVGYECLTGHKAFDGDNSVTIALKQLRQDPEPLPDELPAGVRTLVRRALLKDPQLRYHDGAEFAAAVDDVLEGRPVRRPADVPVAVAATGGEPDGPAEADDAGPGLVTSLLAPAGAAAAVVGPPSGPHTASAPAPHRRRLAAVLVPVLALLVGVGVGIAVLEAFATGDVVTPAVAAQTHDDAAVTLDAAAFVGRPVDDVVAQLTALGLNVRRQQEVTSAHPEGTVTGIDPAGTPLRPGQTVVVRWAAPPPPATTRDTDTGAGRVTEAVVGDRDDSTSAASSARRPAPATTTPPRAPDTRTVAATGEDTGSATTIVDQAVPAPDTSTEEPDPTPPSTPSSSSGGDDPSPSSTASPSTAAAPSSEAGDDTQHGRGNGRATAPGTRG